MRATVLFLAFAGLVPAPAQAQTPATVHTPEMMAAVKARAAAAPEALSRRGLGQVALPTIGTAKFRNVRAYYVPQELVNDTVVFCGELDAVIPSTKKRSGWTKFVYIPGDPTTLMTDTIGLGTPEIGPKVRAHWCDDAKPYLPADYTAEFQRKPRSLAEAESSE